MSFLDGITGCCFPMTQFIIYSAIPPVLSIFVCIVIYKIFRQVSMANRILDEKAETKAKRIVKAIIKSLESKVVEEKEDKVEKLSDPIYPRGPQNPNPSQLAVQFKSAETIRSEVALSPRTPSKQPEEGVTAVSGYSTPLTTSLSADWVNVSPQNDQSTLLSDAVTGATVTFATSEDPSSSLLNSITGVPQNPRAVSPQNTVDLLDDPVYGIKTFRYPPSPPDNRTFPERNSDSEVFPERKIVNGVLHQQNVDKSSTLSEGSFDLPNRPEPKIDNRILPERGLDNKTVPERNLNLKSFPEMKIDNRTFSGRKPDNWTCPTNERDLDNRTIPERSSEFPSRRGAYMVESIDPPSSTNESTESSIRPAKNDVIGREVNQIPWSELPLKNTSAKRTGSLTRRAREWLTANRSSSNSEIDPNSSQRY